LENTFMCSIRALDAIYQALPDDVTDSIEYGTYDVQILDVETYNAPKSGLPVIKWTLGVENEEYSGKQITKRNVLNGANARSLEAFRDDCRTLGLQGPDLSALVTQLSDVVGRHVRVKITSGQNILYPLILFVPDGYRGAKSSVPVRHLDPSEAGSLFDIDDLEIEPPTPRAYRRTSGYPPSAPPLAGGGN